MSGGYFARRLLQILLILLMVITLNFFLPRIIPGNPAERFYADPRIQAEDREKIKAQFGLDKPLGEQYLIYLRNLASGELGMSFTYRRPVIDVIVERIPWTLALTLSSMVLSAFIGIILGVYAAWRHGGLFDMSILSVSIVFSALPSFWFALLLLMLFAFYLPVLPAYGMVDAGVIRGWNMPFILSVAKHALLPVVTLTVLGMIGYAILIRCSVIEVMGQMYSTMARAKGLPERRVLFKHVLRNALLPLITSLGMSLSGLLGGVVIIESIFSWEGMGLLILQSSRSLDYPLMQGVFLMLAILTLFGNLLADVLYGVVDPRVRPQ